ncbi:MAG: hypothetical protein JST22_01365 [Bacteroidetes bacterium]|nr:hypothetical protein [Bacteroidota bacterium]
MSKPIGSNVGEWRVGHQGRDSMYYEEFHDGEWRHLRLAGEMLVGTPHYVIYFGSGDDWKKQPAWACDRRDEIIARIKSACPIPDYRYSGEGVLGESDYAYLIEAAGGLDETLCAWRGCNAHAVHGMCLCVRHAYRDAW